MIPRSSILASFLLVTALICLPLTLSFTKIRAPPVTTQHRSLRPLACLTTASFSRKRGNDLKLFSSNNDYDDGVPSSPLDRPVLTLIDTSALVTFAAVGKASHAADGSLDFGSVLMTALPFLVSWFLAAPLLGCYGPAATSDLKQAVTTVGKGWIVAVPLGCVLRGVIKGYVPPISFVIVTLIATLVILSVGRAAYTALAEVYVEMF